MLSHSSSRSPSPHNSRLRNGNGHGSQSRASSPHPEDRNIRDEDDALPVHRKPTKTDVDTESVDYPWEAPPPTRAPSAMGTPLALPKKWRNRDDTKEFGGRIDDHVEETNGLFERLKAKFIRKGLTIQV